MKDLPVFVKHKFFEFLHGDLSITDFETWVYATDYLEQLLDDESYLGLISADFLQKDSKYEIEKILRPYIDFSEYETWKIKYLLNSLINKKGDPLELLWEFYNLYCNGFHFLNSLGLGYGMATRIPPDGYSSDSWEELSTEEQSKLMDSLFPGAIYEANKILYWLDEGKIVITTNQYNSGDCLFIDRRTPLEKEPVWFKKTGNDSEWHLW
jgi:dimeric dUTPase (all-alpha-NTP-PPase superfamily)